MTSQIDFIN